MEYEFDHYYKVADWEVDGCFPPTKHQNADLGIMECRQQPVSALMLLFFLEVKACLSYPHFILAFSNLKNNYWFF